MEENFDGFLPSIIYTQFHWNKSIQTAVSTHKEAKMRADKKSKGWFLFSTPNFIEIIPLFLLFSKIGQWGVYRGEAPMKMTLVINLIDHFISALTFKSES